MGPQTSSRYTSVPALGHYAPSSILRHPTTDSAKSTVGVYKSHTPGLKADVNTVSDNSSTGSTGYWSPSCVSRYLKKPLPAPPLAKPTRQPVTTNTQKDSNTNPSQLQQLASQNPIGSNVDYRLKRRPVPNREVAMIQGQVVDITTSFSPPFRLMIVAAGGIAKRRTLRRKLNKLTMNTQKLAGNGSFWGPKFFVISASPVESPNSEVAEIAEVVEMTKINHGPAVVQVGNVAKVPGAPSLLVLPDIPIVSDFGDVLRAFRLQINICNQPDTKVFASTSNDGVANANTVHPVDSSAGLSSSFKEASSVIGSLDSSIWMADTCRNLSQVIESVNNSSISCRRLDSFKKLSVIEVEASNTFKEVSSSIDLVRASTGIRHWNNRMHHHSRTRDSIASSSDTFKEVVGSIDLARAPSGLLHWTNRMHGGPRSVQSSTSWTDSYKEVAGAAGLAQVSSHVHNWTARMHHHSTNLTSSVVSSHSSTHVSSNVGLTLRSSRPRSWASRPQPDYGVSRAGIVSHCPGIIGVAHIAYRSGAWNDELHAQHELSHGANRNSGISFAISPERVSRKRAKSRAAVEGLLWNAQQVSSKLKALLTPSVLKKPRFAHLPRVLSVKKQSKAGRYLKKGGKCLAVRFRKCPTYKDF